MKEVEIFFKNIVLKLFLLFNKVQKVDDVNINSQSKVLLIRLNRIGDALVTTPFINQLKKYTGCKIDILADRKNSFVFKNNPDLDNVFVFKKGFSGFRETVKKLNSNNYDIVIDLHDDVSTTVTFLISALKIPVKIALDKGNETVYSKVVKKLDSEKHHVIERNLNILKELKLKVNKEEANIVYSVPESEYEEVDTFLEIYKLKKKKLVGINISAGSEARFWGVENYKQLADQLLSFDVNVILLCHKDDVDKAKAINKTLPIFYSPSFDIFSAMISRLDFLVTPDTSIIHIASAFEIPLFGLYVKYNTKDIIW
ncbi:MAG: glycosyltransferase family 9 protein, partial [Rhodothermaceae bacterium]